MNQKVPDNMISISEKGMTFGKAISNFFDKYNIKNILIILNYNNDSIVIKGVKEDYGISIQKDANNYNITTRMLKFIDFSNLGNYQIARQAFRAVAFPLSKTSILVPNVKLKKKPLAVGNKMYLDVHQKLIIIANFFPKEEIDLNINLNELVRQPKTIPISPSIKNKVTAAPSADKNELTATPSEPESGKLHIYDKGIGNNDLLETTAENSVPSEEQKIIDKEYSKMILGE